MNTIGYAAISAETPLEPYRFERRAPRADDVSLDILFCGVCHSDLHEVRNDWGTTHFPLVPGHEIIGRVSAVGDAVSRYRPGDLVAVGTIVDSCRKCDQCREGHEQFCREGATFTAGVLDRITGEYTQGGYSKAIVVREQYVLRLPDGLDPAYAAPLLCAGVTSWSPLRLHNIGPGSRVGVVGLGGVGHMAVKLAAGLGADVTVISRTPDKEADVQMLGAGGLLVSTDDEAMAKRQASFDLIIDTVPVQHDIAPYVSLLDIDGALVIVGYFGPLADADTVPLIFGRRSITGSPVGSLAETQELLHFCAAKEIVPECEVIRMEQINSAFERMARSAVRYRFVIDMSTLEG